MQEVIALCGFHLGLEVSVIPSFPPLNPGILAGILSVLFSAVSPAS